MSSRNPFERDILSQPEGLRAFAATLDAMPGTLDGLTLERYERVVLTGMGASLYALYSVWLSLVERGYPAWWVDSAELMQEAPGLLRGRTLVWAASQSGRSAEVVTLVEALRRDAPQADLLAVTNDRGSPLGEGWALGRRDRGGHRARGRHPHLREHARGEHDHGARALRRSPGATIEQTMHEVLATADDLALWLTRYDEELGVLADEIAHAPLPLTIVARGASLASALEGSLVIKEAAKHPIEAMSGGQFRHGPIELADEHASFILLASGDAEGRSSQLATDLARAGAHVFWIGADCPTDATPISAPQARSPIGERVSEIVPLQLLSIALARAALVRARELPHRDEGHRGRMSAVDQLIATLLEAAAAKRDRLVELTQELVRIPSVVGDEAAAAHYVEAATRSLGLDVDVFEVDHEAIRTTRRPFRCRRRPTIAVAPTSWQHVAAPAAVARSTSSATPIRCPSTRTRPGCTSPSAAKSPTAASTGAGRPT